MEERKEWHPRKTDTLRRLMRCVTEVQCLRCRYSTPGSPIELPEDWTLFDDGVLLCDECQREDETGERAKTRIR